MAITTILKVAAIPCMLVFILFMFLMIFGGPDNRIIKFLREHEGVQAAFGIIVLIGLLSSFIAVL